MVGWLWYYLWGQNGEDEKFSKISWCDVSIPTEYQVSAWSGGLVSSGKWMVIGVFGCQRWIPFVIDNNMTHTYTKGCPFVTP